MKKAALTLAHAAALRNLIAGSTPLLIAINGQQRSSDLNVSAAMVDRWVYMVGVDLPTFALDAGNASVGDDHFD
jgi:hypothetical protein